MSNTGGPKTRIFISHAEKDKHIVGLFIDLILKAALSIPTSAMFCTSYDGVKIKTGDDWRKSIQQNLLISEVVLLIITSNYKESEMCMNEMGAAWASTAKVIPLIAEPIKYKTAGIIQEPIQQTKLLKDKDLDKLKDVLQEILKISPHDIKTDLWNTKKDNFILSAEKYIAANPFPVPVERAAFDDLIQENNKFKQNITNKVEEITKLKEIIEKLEKVKDKTEVDKIKKEIQPSTQFEEFEALCKNASNALKKVPSIIRGIIFKDYTGKGMCINGHYNQSDIDNALAEDYIDDDYCVIWNETLTMSKIKKALDDLSQFLKSPLTDDFDKEYENEYDAPLDINNLSFWKDVLQSVVTFE